MVAVGSSQPTDLVVRFASCPLCESPRLEPREVPSVWIGEDVFEPIADELGVTRCGDCSYTFVNPRPSEEMLGRFYGRQDYSAHRVKETSADVAKARVQLEIVERYVAKSADKTFLDYGCGGGYLLRAARDSGWSVQGFDIGDKALDTVKTLGLPATNDFDEIKQRKYDVIFLSHVFEHIFEPKALLAELKSILAPGGALFIEVPNVASLRARLSHPVLSKRFNFDQRYRAFPLHLSYFGPKTLQKILEDSGFQVEDLLTTGFGIEELIVQEEPERTEATETKHPKLDDAGPREASGPIGRIKQTAKGVIKKRFFGALLGENLISVARG